MPYPGLLHPEPLPLRRPLLTNTFTGDTQTQFWLSLCGVSGPSCAEGLFEPSDHLWPVRGLIPNVISPLLPSCWGFSFALGRAVSFFGGIQHFPVDSCSAASCNFGVLQEMSAHPSTPTSWSLKNHVDIMNTAAVNTHVQFCDGMHVCFSSIYG